jgi:putative photosynthetic complex assembly protein
MNGFASYHPFPRLPLIGAGLLIASTLVLVASAKLSSVGVYRAPRPQPEIMRDLRFEDLPNGSIAVFDASTDEEAVVLAQGANGFIRGVLRSFARERRVNQDAVTTATSGPPFRISMSADYELSIQDMATGRIVELNAFGETNAGAFAQLLTAHSPQSIGARP